MKPVHIYRQPDGDAASGGNTPKTDNTKLVFADTQYPVYVSPAGGDDHLNEAFPKSNTDYDFCANIGNGSTLPSGAFFVKFTVSNDSDDTVDEYTFKQDSGLDPAASVLAVVHYDKKFPTDFIRFDLEANIYASSAPEKALAAPARFSFTPDTGSIPDTDKNTDSNTNTDNNTTTDTDTDTTGNTNAANNTDTTDLSTTDSTANANSASADSSSDTTAFSPADTDQ